MCALYKLIHTRSHGDDTQSHSVLYVIWSFLIWVQISHIYMFVCTNKNQVVMFTMVPKKKSVIVFLLPFIQLTRFHLRVEIQHFGFFIVVKNSTKFFCPFLSFFIYRKYDYICALRPLSEWNTYTHEVETWQ